MYGIVGMYGIQVLKRLKAKEEIARAALTSSIATALPVVSASPLALPVVTVNGS